MVLSSNPEVVVSTGLKYIYFHTIYPPEWLLHDTNSKLVREILNQVSNF